MIYKIIETKFSFENNINNQLREIVCEDRCNSQGF